MKGLSISANRSSAPGVLLITLAAGLLPLWPLGSYFVLGGAAFILLVKGRLLPAFRKIARDGSLRWMIVFYLVYVAGLLVTADQVSGRKELLSKLPYMLFPVLLLAAKPFPRLQVLLAFVAGTGGMTAWLVGRAAIAYAGSGDIHAFFYERLSGPMHPTYLAMYLNFSILILLELGTAQKEKKGRYTWLYIACCLGLLLVLMTSARMAVISCAVSVYAFLFFRMKAFPRKVWIFLLLLPLLAYTGIQIISKDTNRFTEVNTYIKSDKSSDEGSIAARLWVWKSSLEMAGDHLWTGLGTGDVQAELHAMYARNNMQYALRNNLNAHNQYLQVLLAIGLPGLLIFLLMFIVPGIYAMRKRDILALCFLIVAALNGLTESFLEREAGIFWFVFFYSLLFSRQEQIMK